MSGTTLSLDTAALRELLAELGREAREFRFEVAPNPCVGAAVLAGATEVARGYHRTWGGPHAEIDALAAAADSDVPCEQWDTLVVTLEPCSTEGKTPPCVDAILATGVRTVVVGDLDPDARHRGQGLELLREAGLEVVVLSGAAPLEEVAPHFLRWTAHERLRRPRPWLVAKWAQTLSGHLTPPEDVGEGRWISGPESLAEVQLLRSRVDAVITGAGTVMTDDPRLTLRAPAQLGAPPLRVVMDTWLRTPPEARLFAPAGEGEAAGQIVILCLPGSDRVRRRNLEEAGAEVAEIRGADRQRLHLRSVLGWLWERGARRALLEAGPALLRAYLEAGFVDQMRLITGNVRGGRGESMAAWLATTRLEERLDREVGDDVVLEAFLRSE